MIRRIGFRRLLPVAFTFLHMALVLQAAKHPPHRLSGMNSSAAYHPVEYQEGFSMPRESMAPEPLTPALKVAMLLNLPALLAGLPIAALLLRESDMSLLCASTPFVPLLWFGIGRWVDGLLGFRPVRAAGPWRGFLTVLSTILLGISIVSVTPINRHRMPDTNWIGTAMILWSALFLAMSASGLVRRPAS
jgi:hypothetical protein